MSVIAIIPARGGSKRIPGKNIRDFLGRPMISYPIEVARKCGIFDRIIVSTDNKSIAEVAVAEGAEVPFFRPDELADDHTGTGPVIQHAVNWLIENSSTPQYICCIYPTSPFLSEVYLRSGYEAVKRGRAMAFSVTSFPYPILRALRLLEQGGVEPMFPEYIPCRSQDLEPAFHDAGQFYWGTRDAWVSGMSIFSDNAEPIQMPRHLVHDIDDEEDWVRAEFMYQVMMKE